MRDVQPAEPVGQVDDRQMRGRRRGDHRHGRQHRPKGQHGLDAFTGSQHIVDDAEPHGMAEDVTQGAPWLLERGLSTGHRATAMCDARQ